MTLRAVMFDFDLTLADSSAGIVDCTQHDLRGLGYETVNRAKICPMIGLSLKEMFRSLTGNDQPEPASEFARLFVEHADEVMVSSTQIYPEVPDLLLQLHEQGLDVAIVSSKFRYRIEAILEAVRLRSLIDVIVGGEDVQRHKPHPDGLVLALMQLGMRAASAIYVGDHAVDAQAARCAGVHFVGVVSGTTSFADWSARGEESVMSNIGELADIVYRMGAPARDSSTRCSPVKGRREAPLLAGVRKPCDGVLRGFFERVR